MGLLFVRVCFRSPLLEKNGSHKKPRSWKCRPDTAELFEILRFLKQGGSQKCINVTAIR